MTDAGSEDGAAAEAAERVDPVGEPGVGTPVEPGGDVEVTSAVAASAASEAFQTLANEVRVAVLCELLAAERRSDLPCSFGELQEAAAVDSSAGFAYHLRQLSGRFVQEVDGGYRLTQAGRDAARAVVSGTFTRGLDPDQAS